MPPLYGPPGGADDFAHIPHQLEAWDCTMTAFVHAAAKKTDDFLGGKQSAFFDSVHEPGVGAQTSATIMWNAFPKALTDGNPTRKQALEAAEKLRTDDAGKYRPQDEYLEWHTVRDDHGRIVAVDFTCEGPEFWQSLAHGYPDIVRRQPEYPPAEGDQQRLLTLYRRFVSPDVQLADLLHDGRYDSRNVWNTERGAMHLTHPANCLGAEFFLAAGATILRTKDGHPVTDADALIRCGKFGKPGRSSDPTIGAAVNELVRAGKRVGLRSPVGVYLHDLDTADWTKPDGSPVGDYWRVLRGTADRVLRARYEVPAAEGCCVGDLKIGGEPIDYAGQLAERITMRLVGVAVAARDTAPVVPCGEPRPPQHHHGPGSAHGGPADSGVDPDSEPPPVELPPEPASLLTSEPSRLAS